MDIRALLFDVNGTLIDIETDEWMEECYRAIAHFLTYQGIALHRGEVRDLYFQIMKEQFAASTEKYPEFDVVAVWREVLRRYGTDYTRSLAAGNTPANASVPGRNAAGDFPQKASRISPNTGNSRSIENALSPGGGLRCAKRLWFTRAARRRPGRIFRVRHHIGRLWFSQARPADVSKRARPRCRFVPNRPFSLETTVIATSWARARPG